MKEFKGTPGPWYWDEEGLGSKNHIVFGKEYPAEMTSKANKALIAAAPELLEALQNMIGAFDNPIVRRKLPSTFNCEAIQSARAAINKALGGIK